MTFATQCATHRFRIDVACRIALRISCPIPLPKNLAVNLTAANLDRGRNSPGQEDK